MGWLLPEEDHNENQLKIYEELLSNSKEQFEALEGVDGSPEVEIQRNQLSAQIKQIELQIEEAKGRSKSIDERNETGGLDLFED